MELTVGSRTVTFGIPDTAGDIGIQVGAGIDSAVTLYVVAKYLNDTSSTKKLFIFNRYQTTEFSTSEATYNKQNQRSRTSNIIDYVQDAFPDVNWHGSLLSYNGDYDTAKETSKEADERIRNPLMREHNITHLINGRTITYLTEDELTALDKPDAYPTYRAGHISQMKRHKATWERLRANGDIQNNLANNAIDSGKHDETTDNPWTYRIQKPWAAVDKKFLTDLCSQWSITDLLDLTISCWTDDTPPCQKCPGCKEKFKVLGKY